jgi:hypothetical protein
MDNTPGYDSRHDTIGALNPPQITSGQRQNSGSQLAHLTGGLFAQWTEGHSGC